MIKLKIQNFRGLADFELEDESPLTIIVGPNAAGKSSIAQAIEFAFTGSACGLKGSGAFELIHQGQSRMKVELQLPSWQLSRSKGSGVALKDIACRLGVQSAALPAFFNPEVAVDSGNKAVKAFLDGAVDSPLQADECIANRPELKPFFEEALNSTGGRPKEMQKFAEQRRSASKPPGEPVAPTQALPSHVATSEIERTLEAARTELAEGQKHVEILRGQLNLLQRCRAFVEALAAYELRAQTVSSDPLNGRRPALEKLSALSLGSLVETVDTLESAGFKEAASALSEGFRKSEYAKAEARNLITANPVPPQLGPAPRLSPETGEMFESLEDRSFQGISAKIQEAEVALSDPTSALQKLQAHVEALISRQRELAVLRGMWENYDTQRKRYLSEVTRLSANWDAWNELAKRIASAEETRRRDSGRSLLGRISSLGKKILAGRELTIADSGEVLLSGRRFGLLSGSEKWRVGIAVMAAIALEVGSPVLVLDGADVLDDHNREELRNLFLDDIFCRFEHTLLLSTARGDGTDRVPFRGNGSKWYLETGRAQKCE